MDEAARARLKSVPKISDFGTAQFCRTSSLFSGVFDPSFPRGLRNRLLTLCQAHGSIQMEQRRTARVEAGLRQGQRSAVARPPRDGPIMKVGNEPHRARQRDQKPGDHSGEPKDCVDHGCAS
jgi:hypothetical protein